MLDCLIVRLTFNIQLSTFTSLPEQALDELGVLLGVAGGNFTLAAFVTGAFTGAIPGIILQIIIIPLIVSALERSGFIGNEKKSEKSEKSI